MSLFDNQSIEIPCGNCGRKVKKTVAWLKRNKKLVCAGCGIETTLETKKFLAGIKQVSDKLKRF